MDAVRRFGIVGGLTLAASVGCSLPDRPTSLYPGTFGGTKEEQTRAFAESSTAAYQSAAKTNAPVARPQAPADPPAPVVPLAGPDFTASRRLVSLIRDREMEIRAVFKGEPRNPVRWRKIADDPGRKPQ